MVKVASLLALALGFVGVTTATHSNPKRSDHNEIAERGLERRETRYTVGGLILGRERRCTDALPA